MTPGWIAAVVLASLGGFVGFWCAVVLLISRFGWARLAAQFATREPPPGAMKGLRVAWVGGARYRGLAMSAGSDHRGLYLRAASVFRPGHPPLLIPRPLLRRGQQGERRDRLGRIAVVEIVIQGAPLSLWLTAEDADRLLP